MNREDNYINQFLDRKVKITWFDNTTDIGILVKNDNRYQKAPYKLRNENGDTVFFKSHIKKNRTIFGDKVKSNRKVNGFIRKMKFTSKDLARAMGLKVGDRIKYYTVNCVCVIDKNYQLYDERAKVRLGSIAFLINEEFEILPPKKKVGELKCCNIDCKNCPLNLIRCSFIDNHSLYDILDYWFGKYEDQEIYDIIKKRLDREVKEDE